jgi:hypothetical protein
MLLDQPHHQFGLLRVKLAEFIDTVRQKFDQAGRGRETPALVTSPRIRRSCVASSSASAPRPACCRSRRSTLGRG